MSDTPKPKKSWMKWLLIPSLALNLAVVGAVAGFALRDNPSKGGQRPPADLMREIARAFPENHREQLKRDFSAKRGEMKVYRNDIRKGREALARVLASPNFDISQVVTILDNHRVILSRISAGGHEIVIRRIESMTPQERLAFSQNLKRLQDRYVKNKENGRSSGQ